MGPAPTSQMPWLQLQWSGPGSWVLAVYLFWSCSLCGIGLLGLLIFKLSQSLSLTSQLSSLVQPILCIEYLHFHPIFLLLFDIGMFTFKNVYTSIFAFFLVIGLIGSIIILDHKVSSLFYAWLFIHSFIIMNWTQWTEHKSRIQLIICKAIL